MPIFILQREILLILFILIQMVFDLRAHPVSVVFEAIPPFASLRIGR